MRPAFSVIFLTTLIGVGQGLLVALVAGQFYFVIGAGDRHEASAFYAIGAALALVFLGLGLFASFFHLANPQRAWRSITRWRTSWLSREVLVLPAVMGMAFIYAVVHWFKLQPVLLTFSNEKSLDLTMAVGFVAAGSALLLLIVTGMIYACVRFIREWSSSWTVINYSVLGLASGFTFATAYAGLSQSSLTNFMSVGALLLTLLGTVTRSLQLMRNAKLGPAATMKSAIGIGPLPIRQITQGFMGQSFNTQEYFAPGGRDAVRGLTVAFLFLVFALPLVLMVSGMMSGQVPFFIAAFIVQYLGLLAERWVFFAQAHHVQNLYYQARA